VGQACEQEGFANHEEAMSVIEKWYAEWWDATWRALCGEPSKVMHPKPSLAVAGGVTMSHWTDPLRGGACADEIKDGRQYDTFAGWWGGTQHADDMLSLSAILDGWIDALVRFSETEPETLTKDGDQNSLTIRIAFNPKNDHYVKMVVHANDPFGKCFYLLPPEEEFAAPDYIQKGIASGLVATITRYFRELKEAVLALPKEETP